MMQHHALHFRIISDATGMIALHAFSRIFRESAHWCLAAVNNLAPPLASSRSRHDRHDGRRARAIGHVGQRVSPVGWSAAARWLRMDRRPALPLRWPQS